ncbi:hypothetical protein ACROYT_G006807 [Oculina patagonica]
MIACRGPCRSFEEPVKSPFDMYMDPASRNTALRNKYDVYQYHLMTPRTPIERHKVVVPTPPTQPLAEPSAPAAAFDFGAVLRMQAEERAHVQGRDRHVRDPLLKKEQGDSSPDINNVEPKKVNRITVDIESTDQPLIHDSSV